MGVGVCVSALLSFLLLWSVLRRRACIHPLSPPTPIHSSVPPQHLTNPQCVRHGTVRRIVTPDNPYYEGAVAVVFEATEGALACAKAMHGRFFDGRQIEVELQGRVEKDALPERVLPVSHPAAGLVSTEYVEEGEEFVDVAVQVREREERERRRREEEEAAAAVVAAAGGGEEGAQQEAEDVEAFLKSLEGGS